VIPQLTADTMRHHRTTNRAVPHGKRMRRTGRFRGFACAYLLAARLKGSYVSAGAEVAPSSRLHLVHRAVPTPRTWYIARQTDTFHSIHVLTQRVYQAPQLAAHLTPPNLPLPFIPRPDVQDGLGSKSHTRWKGLASILTALESLGIQQQQNGSCSSLAHSRSSRPPATDVQMHSRSDPISLGGRPAFCTHSLPIS
jgi:hypothetical protein